MEVRSSSIFSRNLESRSDPPSTTPSTTFATSRSQLRSSRSSPAEISRSAICSLRSPPQMLRSVVTGVAVVEERRRELVRAGCATLAEERRDERRLGVGRRLLLVLAVVSRLALAPEEPEDEGDHDQRGEERERREHPECAQRVRDPVVDP